MIDATNISRLFRLEDTSIKELVIQCKTVIKDNKILLKTMSYERGLVREDDDKVFNSITELLDYYNILMGNKLVELKGVPVKVIGDMDTNGTGKGFMATSDIFHGLDIMPIKSIENTLVLDYADINYIRAIPLRYILGGKISKALALNRNG